MAASVMLNLAPAPHNSSTLQSGTCRSGECFSSAGKICELLKLQGISAMKTVIFPQVKITLSGVEKRNVGKGVLFSSGTEYFLPAAPGFCFMGQRLGQGDDALFLA